MSAMDAIVMHGLEASAILMLMRTAKAAKSGLAALKNLCNTTQ